MSQSVVLKGITWNHSRGITPLLAASQRFGELHPGVDIQWTKRSLQEFADYPLEKLTDQYDLLIIDHPWVGRAAALEAVLPLDTLLPGSFLRELRQYSVGQSYASYEYDSHLWALPIDAATPVASYRQDLLPQPPPDWVSLLDLARSGRVVFAGIPIDLLMAFYLFCQAVGEQPFVSTEEIVSQIAGLEALELMRELTSHCHKAIFDWNPIAVAEAMTATDDFFYCPFAYGYANYSRKGYANRSLTYTDLPAYRNKPLISTLGGTGLAVSAQTTHSDWALQFAQWVCSGLIQRTLYYETGGQPAHRTAWEDKTVNQHCNSFFQNTLPALDRAFVRPRYNGYLHFQDLAGDPIQRYLKQGGEARRVLETINSVYRESQLIYKRTQ